MAVPKKRTGKSAQATRRANWKATKPEVNVCPNCGAFVLAHTVCTSCGFYKGKPVSLKDKKTLEVAEEAKKAKKTTKKAKVAEEVKEVQSEAVVTEKKTTKKSTKKAEVTEAKKEEKTEEPKVEEPKTEE